MLSLALLWWLTLGGLGLFFPYYTLFLRENAGLDGAQIGIVMATLPLVGLVAQPFWGQLADRTGHRTRVLSLLALGTAAGYAALSLPEHFKGYLIATAALAFFAAALLPTCIAVSLAALPRDGHAFGRVRAVGTLGFACSVGFFPRLLRAWQRHMASPGAISGVGEPGLQILFYGAGLLLLLAAVFSLRLPARESLALRARRGEWRTLLSQGAFLRTLFFTFLIYLAIQGPMVLFPILVRAQGGGIEAISHMWLIMLILEVPLIFSLGAALARIGPRGVIAIGVVAAGLRWSASGFIDDLRWVYAVQILHGVTVWGVILGLPIYVDALVPERLRATGQGLLAMIGVSLGSIFSNLAAGALSDWLGAKAPAQVGGILACLLALALPWMLPAPANAQASGEGPQRSAPHCAPSTPRLDPDEQGTEAPPRVP